MAPESGPIGNSDLGSLHSASSAPAPFQTFQEFLPSMMSQWKAYENVVVQKVKDALMIAYDHPNEVGGVAIVSSLILMRGPRKFLIRNTLGRFATEEGQIAKVKSHFKELEESLEGLKKESKNMFTRTAHAEEDLLHGRTKIRAAGREIQRLSKSIYKTETQAEDLMDDMRSIPGETALRLRAELASMKSDLKNERLELNKRIVKVTELGIRV